MNTFGRAIAKRLWGDREPTTLIVGLGNPGHEYEDTRHNAGFWVIDRLASHASITLADRSPRASIGEGKLAGVDVVLAKPRTFVNRSGEAVKYLLRRYDAAPDKLLVVYDDMNIELGKLRLRPNGSAGGHNGIKSIIQALATQDFPRLRLGIGDPGSPSGHVDHVLGTMGDEEREAADEMVGQAVEAIETALSSSIAEAMNRFN